MRLSSSLYNNLISWLSKSIQFISIRRFVIADPSPCLCCGFFRLTYTFHLSTYDISSLILFERLNSTLLLSRSSCDNLLFAAKDHPKHPSFNGQVRQYPVIAGATSDFHNLINLFTAS